MYEPFLTYAKETSLLSTFEDCMSRCSCCSLADEKNKPIVYRGNPDAEIMIVGEAPGKVEQQEGKPFVGPAGQLLDKIMGSININTDEDTFITNSVFCRPVAAENSGKENYTPKENQLEKCNPFLRNLKDRIVRPKVIIACGRIALGALTNKSKLKLGDYEGAWHQCKGIPMFVMRHPAAILYLKGEEQAEVKKKVWSYMKIFRDTYKEKIDASV